MSPKQKTLRKPVKFAGIGLHSGRKINCTIRPAPANHGIVFHVRKGDKVETIAAEYRNIGHLTYNTGLQRNGCEVLTVEHILSALHGFRIDNAVIELDNHEVPVMDGSAASFVYLLNEAGVATLDAPVKTVRLTRTVSVAENGAWIRAEPTSSDGLEVVYSIDFNHPMIGKMTYAFSVDPVAYCRNIAPARTFGFLKEVNYLRRKGLIRGASLQNAIVLDDRRIISGDLRFPDEFVRHKILDFWGDIVLLGRPLIAKIYAHRAGHKLHSKLVGKLLKTPGILVPAFEKQPRTAYNPAPQAVPAP